MKLPALQPTPENIAICNEMLAGVEREGYLNVFYPRWRMARGTHDKAKIIERTFALFAKHYEIQDMQRYRTLKHILIELTSEKDFVYIDGHIFSLCAYRVLFWCRQADMLINFVNDKQRDRYGAWSMHNQNKKEGKNKFVNLRNNVAYKQTAADKTLLGRFVYQSQYRRKKTIEFLATLCAYYPPWFHSKAYMEATQKEREMFNEKLYHAWNSHAIPQTIAKSIAIVIGQFLRFRCGLSANKAGEKVYLIFENFFAGRDYKIFGAEIFKNIYLKSVLMGVPIYGSNKLGYRADEPQLKRLATTITNDFYGGKVPSEWHNLLLYNTCRLELNRYPTALLESSKAPCALPK